MAIEETGEKNPTLGERIKKARLEKQTLPRLKKELEELNNQVGLIDKEVNSPDATLQRPRLIKRREEVLNEIENAKQSLGIKPETDEEKEAA